LRDFAIIAGRNLRSEQKQVGETTLRSISYRSMSGSGSGCWPWLKIPCESSRLSLVRCRLSTSAIAEAPLIAGLGSNEFAGLEVIASAYYVDFDSPAMRNLPEIIREQRPSVKKVSSGV